MASAHHRSLELWNSLTWLAVCLLLLLCYHLPSTHAQTGMASSEIPRSSCALLLILLVGVSVTPVQGASGQRVPITDTVTACYPATNATNSTVFRANVVALLGRIPSAAAPTGFATLRTTTGRSDGAFVRGLCFDDAAPQDCFRCLSVAATNLSSSCGINRHRAGIWSDGCFVSYADANATTPSEDALCPRVISGNDPVGRNASGPDLERLASVAQFLAPRAALSDNMLATVYTTAVAWNYAERGTVRVLAQCARDRTPAECDRCLEYSARVAASCCWGLNPWRDGVAGAVLGFNCYLRFEVSTVLVPLREMIALMINDYPITTALLTAVVVVLLLGGLARVIKAIYSCWTERKIRTVNNARNAAAASDTARV